MCETLNSTSQPFKPALSVLIISFSILSWHDKKLLWKHNGQRGKINAIWTSRKLRFRLTPRDKSIKSTLFLKSVWITILVWITFISRLNHVESRLDHVWITFGSRLNPVWIMNIDWIIINHDKCDYKRF